MSNCSIWVEGITDRIYLRSYLKAYEINKKNEPDYIKFKEDIHYSFFEYAGSNLSHYIFDNSDDFQEEKNKIKGQFLSNKIFLIADKDEKKKQNIRNMKE